MCLLPRCSPAFTDHVGPDPTVTFGWILLIDSKVVRAGQTVWSQILDFFGKYSEYLLVFYCINI